MLKTVVFDLGQVVIKWDPFGSQEGFLTSQEWDDFLVRTDFWSFNRSLDAGVDLAVARKWFQSHYPADLEIFDRYVARFPATLRGPVPGMLELIEDLHAMSVPTAVLSNWPHQLFGHALAHLPVIDKLGPRIVSGEVGLAKPDRRIFERLLQLIDKSPKEVVFIDDNVDNVEAASALGIDAILFTDADQLRTELVQRRLAPTMGLHHS
ncbi:MAG: HAD family phosphatase [Actinomycetaceae bacterium]|nr:HAD family phosphatase [Actinomycetaceae bacterium]